MAFAVRCVDVSPPEAAGQRSTGRERRSQAIEKPDPAQRAVGRGSIGRCQATGPALSPAAQSVADEIAAIERGQVMTISALRVRLAARSGTGEFGTGDFSAAALKHCLKLLAGAVADDLRHRRHARWPIWRVTNDNGQLPGNWPLDARWRAAMLRDEGRVIRYLKSAWFTSSTTNLR